jgi:hypothetical protein
MSNVLAIGIENIKQNWPKYRCNPMVMPFVSIVGPDNTTPGSNFAYCVQNMQTNYMEYLLQPVNYSMNAMGTVALSLSESSNKVREMIDSIRTGIADIIQNVFGVFLNIIIEFQKNVINIKDLFGKLVGVLATFIYLLSGSVMSMQSAWAGPPGKMVRTLSSLKIPRCFHPDTLVKTKGGEFIKMKDLKLGEMLLGNTEVIAVMNISNLDKNKKPIQPFYKIKGGENKEDIYVSGTHLIYETNDMNFIQVKHSNKSIKTDIYSDSFCCLITTNNIIPIGEHIFHDWEDNQGSLSKKI